MLSLSSSGIASTSANEYPSSPNRYFINSDAWVRSPCENICPGLAKTSCSISSLGMTNSPVNLTSDSL